MAWLIAQMWLWLLIAAAFGGMIGWALHVMHIARGEGPLLPGLAPRENANGDQARIAELETQLAQEREELEATRSKATADLAMTAGAGDGEGSVAWRNRYLESRVRFLEGKLTDLEAAAAPEQPREDTNDEGTRLRWRNRYLEGRVKYLEEELVRGDHIVVTLPSPPAPTYPGNAAAAGGVATLERPAASAGTKPAMLSAPRDGRGDDLKEIAGIGPKLEKMLQSLGVYHFDQIAAWTPAEIDWVNAAISFRGRIERERWVEQAQRLAARA
jgi:predicted flap endonuclease-1-like 5' DNA nuclease